MDGYIKYETTRQLLFVYIYRFGLVNLHLTIYIFHHSVLCSSDFHEVKQKLKKKTKLKTKNSNNNNSKINAQKIKNEDV